MQVIHATVSDSTATASAFNAAFDKVAYIGGYVPLSPNTGKAKGRFMADTPRHTTAASLHAAITAAAGVAMNDTANTHIFFRTATGAIKLKNEPARLTQFARDMAKTKKTWELWGGGPMPADVAPVRKTATVWNANALKVCRELIEDNDAAAALDVAFSKLGGVVFEHGRGAFLLVAPQAVEGLPDVFRSGFNVDAGRWVVYCNKTGSALAGNTGKKLASRASVETEAIKKWEGVTPEAQARVLSTRLIGEQPDALATWCAHWKIEKPGQHNTTADTAPATPAADTTPAPVADVVADVVAQAAAAAAIDTAQESAAAAELAMVADVVADVVADTVAADVVADVEELATVAEPAAAMAADVVAMGGTPGTGTPGHTGHATPATAHRHSTPGAAGGAGGQRIAGKSGQWVATFHTTPAGLPGMVYTGPDGQAQALEFSTGRERMATLQRLAREADTTPAPQPAHKNNTGRAMATGAHVAGVQHAAAAERMVFGCWTVRQVQGWKDAEFAEHVNRYEDINHHTAALALHCLQAGRLDLAIECERIEREHMAAGRLTEELSQARQAVAAALKTPTGTDTPPPAAPVAAELAPVSGADGQDYTHPLKTSEPDYTHPLKTSAGALSITITRGEGPTELCGIPHTVGSFDAADALLLAWADTVRPGGCCDKVDFSITWPDGSGYAGRYELQHHATARPSLAGHMVDLADFYTGKGCPAHMSEAAYLRHLEHISADTRAAYEEATRQLNAAGIHTGKARPVSCDLRDLVAMGLAVADLVGLGVTYCGDMNSGPEVGAIVAAEAIEHNPRFYRVGLMGRDVRPDLAAVPQIRVTVRTECGAEHTAHHDDFGHDVGARYRLDQKRHGAPYLAQLAAAVAMRRAQATAAKELEAKAHAEELARLAVEFAHLERASERHGGGVFAARNIRAELKRAFPGVKFSVKSDYSSVGVRWTDGPTDAQVCEVIGRFDIGASDSQTDYFYTVCTAFSELFGGVQYLNTYRDTSDELTAEAIAEFWAANFADVANAPAMPTPADWRNNAGFFDWRADNWQTRNFRDHLNAKAGPAPTPAKASKKAKA